MHHGASHAGQIDYAATGYDLVASAIQEGIKTLCSAIPGIEIAPLGAGTEANPDDICGQAGTSEVGNHLSHWWRLTVGVDCLASC